MSFLLNTPRAGLQSELNAFFDHALGEKPSSAPTKSALCQARGLLDPAALKSLITHSHQVFTQNSKVADWHGLRVLALDSTVVRVPNVPECVEAFGGMTTSCGKFRPLARASVVLDVARECFVDAFLGGYDEADRALAQHHLPRLGAGDLLVMDRGYPSRDLFQQLQAAGIPFCARIAERWTGVQRFKRSGLDEDIVELGCRTAPLPLRLVRVVLPSGASQILVTNLLNPALMPAHFGELYHHRWRIEEAFKLIKARLDVENWSGILPHTVRQDFYASLVRANCAAVIALAARPEEARLGHPPTNAKGWRLKLNRTLTLKSLKHFLSRLLLGIDWNEALEHLIARLRGPNATERTRPDRHAPRKAGVKLAGFHPGYKAA